MSQNYDLVSHNFDFVSQNYEILPHKNKVKHRQHMLVSVSRVQPLILSRLSTELLAPCLGVTTLLATNVGEISTFHTSVQALANQIVLTHHELV